MFTVTVSIKQCSFPLFFHIIIPRASSLSFLFTSVVEQRQLPPVNQETWAETKTSFSLNSGEPNCRPPWSLSASWLLHKIWVIKSLWLPNVTPIIRISLWYVLRVKVGREKASLVLLNEPQLKTDHVTRRWNKTLPLHAENCLNVCVCQGKGGGGVSDRWEGHICFLLHPKMQQTLPHAAKNIHNTSFDLAWMLQENAPWNFGAVCALIAALIG